MARSAEDLADRGADGFGGSCGGFRQGVFELGTNLLDGVQTDMDQETITSVGFDSQLMLDALDLRREVFVLEQGVPPEMEVDDEDKGAIHLVATIGARVIATLRIVSTGNTGRIGRIAVRRDFRGRGIGGRIVEHAMRLILENGGREIALHAQIQTIDFYRRLGYCEEGEVELDAGIPHIWMRKSLDSSG